MHGPAPKPLNCRGFWAPQGGQWSSPGTGSVLCTASQSGMPACAGGCAPRTGSSSPDSTALPGCARPPPAGSFPPPTTASTDHAPQNVPDLAVVKFLTQAPPVISTCGHQLLRSSPGTAPAPVPPALRGSALDGRDEGRPGRGPRCRRRCHGRLPAPWPVAGGRHGRRAGGRAAAFKRLRPRHGCRGLRRMQDGLNAGEPRPR